VRRAALGLALLLAWGCNDDGGAGFVGADAGLAPFDAGADRADADAGAAPPNQDAGVDAGFPVDEFTAAPGGFRLCLDQVDNDNDQILDCAEQICLVNVPACCVGSGEVAACCESPASEPLFELAGCSGTLDTCSAFEGASFFGNPYVAEYLFGPGVVPGGETVDSGVVLPRELDARSAAVTVTADIAAEVDGCADCVDVSAFGLLLVERLPVQNRVRPEVAVLVNGTDEEIALVLEEEVVGRWTLPDGSPRRYGLTVEPDGTVVFRVDGAVLSEGLRLPEVGVFRPVLYGRTPNPGFDEETTRVQAMTVQQARCDIPAATSRDPSPVVPAPSDPILGALSGLRAEQPSVLAYDDGGPRLAMAARVEGSIRLLRDVPDGFVLRGSLGDADLVGLDAIRVVTATHPTLARDGSRFRLYFVGVDGNDAGRLYAVTQGDDGRFDASFAELLIDAPDDAVDIEDASVVELEGGGQVVAATVRDADGSRRLAVYTVSGGTVRELRTTGLARTDLAFDAFDRDERAGVALLQTRQLWRLYVAGRRGSRWSIGVFVSPDLSVWRRVGEVLGASGHGHDALGVRDPAPVALEGRLRVYYTGLDGVRRGIGVADGPAPLY
jgi:hypothetical protein